MILTDLMDKEDLKRCMREEGNLLLTPTLETTVIVNFDMAEALSPPGSNVSRVSRAGWLPFNSESDEHYSCWLNVSMPPMKHQVYKGLGNRINIIFSRLHKS